MEFAVVIFSITDLLTYLLELPAGRGRPCLWLFFVRAEWLGTVRTLLTNPKAFQTQANQHVNFRNFGFVGAVWPKFSGNRFVTLQVLISWETSYLTNKKIPSRSDAQIFPFLDFRAVIFVLWLWLSVTCWFFLTGDSLWKPAKAGIIILVNWKTKCFLVIEINNIINHKLW